MNKKIDRIKNIINLDNAKKYNKFHQIYFT